MAHKLSINIQDGVNDNLFIHVNDLSIYDEMLGTDNRVLQVLPHFSDEWVVLNFPKSKYASFSSIDLQLSEDLQDIPDGPFYFHFSIAPNSQVFTVQNYFRVSQLMNNVLAKMTETSITCDTYVDECGNISFTKNQNVLLQIWMLLKGAQAIGSTELGVQKARQLYHQAQRAYDKLVNPFKPVKN